MSVQNESLWFRMRIHLTMSADMHSEAEPGCKRRRLMHKQTVCEVDWRGHASGAAASSRMSLVGDGSHAHLSANVVLPVVSSQARFPPIDQDVPNPLTNPPPAGSFDKKTYNRVYQKVSRWILTPAGALYSEIWERCKLRRAVGQGLLPEQKKTPSGVHAFQKGSAR